MRQDRRGAWSDTPRRGRPALYRGKRGRAISLRNAPRRSPAHPQTHGGNTVGSRSAQGDGPSVGPLIGPLFGLLVGPLFGIYGRGRRPRRPTPGAERPIAGPGAWGRTGARDARLYQRRGPHASRSTWGPGRMPAPTPRAEGGAGTARAKPDVPYLVKTILRVPVPPRAPW